MSEELIQALDELVDATKLLADAITEMRKTLDPDRPPTHPLTVTQDDGTVLTNHAARKPCPPGCDCADPVGIPLMNLDGFLAEPDELPPAFICDSNLHCTLPDGHEGDHQLKMP